MRVRCITDTPSDEQIGRLGRYYQRGKTKYVVEPGQEYTVLGLSFFKGISWFRLHVGIRVLASFPAFLFAIVDPAASRHWEVRIAEDGTSRLWPPSFYRDYYADDFSDGEPEVMEDLAAVEALLESEARQGR